MLIWRFDLVRRRALCHRAHAHCHRARACACSSPRPPPGCSTHPFCVAPPQREHCFIMAWALHPSASATPLSSPHTSHTRHRLPHSQPAPACHTRSPLQLQRPCPAETRPSCLRAAIACTSNLIGGIPRPFVELSVARVQPSSSTYVVTSLYDQSDCCDACSDRALLSARRCLPGHVRARRERDLDTL